MKKWYRTLGKTAQTAVIVGAVLAVLSLTVVAVWAITKDISGTGEIIAGFELTDFVGGSILEGSEGGSAVAECLVTNLTDVPMLLSDVTLDSSALGITIEDVYLIYDEYGNWGSGTDPFIAPLASLRVGVRWSLGEGYEVGDVALTLHVTCSGD